MRARPRSETLSMLPSWFRRTPDARQTRRGAPAPTRSTTPLTPVRATVATGQPESLGQLLVRSHVPSPDGTRSFTSSLSTRVSVGDLIELSDRGMLVSQAAHPAVQEQQCVTSGLAPISGLRPAAMADAPALAQLEAASWSPRLRMGEQAIRARLGKFGAGQVRTTAAPPSAESTSR